MIPEVQKAGKDVWLIARWSIVPRHGRRFVFREKNRLVLFLFGS